MSNEMWVAAASTLTAIFTVFGVKLLDTLSSRNSKRFDELVAIRQSQATRIENLEKKLEEREREFDKYQLETNEKISKMNEELWKLRTENLQLQLRLAKGQTYTD